MKIRKDSDLPSDDDADRMQIKSIEFISLLLKQIITVMQNHLSLLLLVSNEMLYHD